MTEEYNKTSSRADKGTLYLIHSGSGTSQQLLEEKLIVMISAVVMMTLRITAVIRMLTIVVPFPDDKDNYTCFYDYMDDDDDSRYDDVNYRTSSKFSIESHYRTVPCQMK